MGRKREDWYELGYLSQYALVYHDLRARWINEEWKYCTSHNNHINWRVRHNHQEQWLKDNNSLLFS